MAFQVASNVKTFLEASHETSRRELKREARAPGKGRQASAKRLHSYIEPLNRAKDRIEAVAMAIRAAGFPGDYPGALCSDLKTLKQHLSGANERPSVNKIQEAYRKAFACLEGIEEAADAARQPKAKVVDSADEETKFNILFLSDLHWKGVESRLRWNGIGGHFLDAVGTAHKDCGGIDLVLFAGDLVFSGERKLFVGKESVTAQFLDKLRKRLDILGCRAPLLTLPGNHDLKRPALKKKAKQDLPGFAQRVGAAFFALERPRRGSAADHDRHLVTAAFTQYLKWSKNSINTQVGSGILPKGSYRLGMAPGDFSCRIEKNGLRIGVVGLNSSCVQLLGGDFRGHLHVDRRQFEGALPDNRDEWLHANDTNILMTHHPVGWLTPESAKIFCNEIFDSRLFSLHLHGHMHKEKYEGLSSEPGDTQHHFQSPSLFSEVSFFDGALNEKVRKTGYCILQLCFKTDRIDLRLRPRVFTEKARERQPETFELARGWTERIQLMKRPRK